jgi:hypothetical protein
LGSESADIMNQLGPNRLGKSIGGVSRTNFQQGACRQAVALRVLKPNPTRRLYERLGFEIVSEAPERCLMRCQP